MVHMPLCLVILSIACRLNLILAHPNGAGPGVCDDGTPGGTGSSTHGDLGEGDGGFSLEFSPALPSPSTYSPGTRYQITLRGGISFRGFAIVPLTAETGPLTPGGNSRVLPVCADVSDDAGLTHLNSHSKMSAGGTWTATASGTAKLRWTVLTTYRGMWYKQTIRLTAAAPTQRQGRRKEQP